MAGMLSHLVKSASQRKVVFLHADDSLGSFALRDQVVADLKALPDASMSTWLLNAESAGGVHGETHTGFMDVHAVDLPDDAEYYLCGPVAFMQSVRTALVAAGVPVKDIQYEVFGPDLWLADYQ
jgi:nitric oxide dioxygenase